MAFNRKGAKIQHDILSKIRNKTIFKTSKRIELKNLDDYEVLSSYISGLITSATSLTSSVFAASLASTASTALFRYEF